MENTNIEINNNDSKEILEVAEETLETEEVLSVEEKVVEDTQIEEKLEDVKKSKGTTKKEPKVDKQEVEPEAPKKVAVYSERNLYKYELGELTKGYSILPTAKAEKWIASTKKVRIATPEEVAKYYNK